MSIVSGTIGAVMSADEAESATDASKHASQDQLRFAREQWDVFMARIRPMIAEVSKPLEEQEGFAGRLASVERGYSDAAANVMRRTGGQYQYGGGVEEAKLQNLELSKTRDRAKVYSEESARKWDKLSTIASLTRGLPSSAAAGISGAAGNLAVQAYGANRDAATSITNIGQGVADVYGIGAQQGWWGGSGAGKLDYSKLQTTPGGAIYSAP